MMQEGKILYFITYLVLFGRFIYLFIYSFGLYLTKLHIFIFNFIRPRLIIHSFNK